jgi:hypothetical protein
MSGAASAAETCWSMLEEFIGDGRSSDCKLDLLIHADEEAVVIVKLALRHAAAHPERARKFVARAYQQIARWCELRETGPTDAWNGDELQASMNAVRLLAVLMHAPECHSQRQLALDRMHQLMQVPDRKNSKGGTVLQPTIKGLMTDPLSPLDDQTLHEEDVCHEQLLLDHTPLPRDLVLMCVTYERTPRMAPRVLAATVRVLFASAQNQTVVPSLALDLLTPNSIVSVSCIVDTLEDLASDNILTVERLAHSTSLFSKLADAGSYATPAYWRAWLKCGLAEALHHPFVWIGAEGQVRGTTIYVMCILNLLKPLAEPSVVRAADACFYDLLEAIGGDIELFNQEIFERAISTFLQPLDNNLSYGRALDLITNHRLLGLLRFLLEIPKPSVQGDALAVLLYLCTLEDGRMLEPLRFLLSLRPRGFKAKSTLDCIVALDATPPALRSLLQAAA